MSKTPPHAHEDICAHEPCQCAVDADRKYCCEACAEAAKGGSHEICPCGCQSLGAGYTHQKEGSQL